MQNENRLPALLLLFSMLWIACQPARQWHGQRVLILGDSITQQGTYVSILEYALRKTYPERNYDIISIGLGSETLSCLTEDKHPYPRPCLKERLDRAIEKIEPEFIVACYGMNDGIYHPLNEERMQAFQEGVFHLATTSKAAKAPLLIITPPPFDSLAASAKLADEGAPEFGYAHPYRGYDLVLGAFGDWQVEEAGRQWQVVDLHRDFKAQLMERRKTQADFSYAADGVHPTPEGHLLIARIIARQSGMQVDAVLGQDAETIFNDPLFKLVDQRRRARSEAWLPYVGYTRGKVVASNSLKDLEATIQRLDKEIKALQSVTQ